MAKQNGTRRQHEARAERLERLGEAVLVDPAARLRGPGRRRCGERDGRVASQLRGAERLLAKPCAELVDILLPLQASAPGRWQDAATATYLTGVNVGVGIVTPTSALQVSGTFTVSSTQTGSNPALPSIPSAFSCPCSDRRTWCAFSSTQ